MSAPTKIKIGSWIASPALNLLERGEQSVKLESRTMDVLVYLARRAGEVVSVEELLGAVWQGVIVTDSSAYQAIKQLRQALGGSDDGAAFIETIPKRGYRLVAPVGGAAPEPAPVEAAAPAPAQVVAARDTVPARRAPRRPVRWLEVAAVLVVVVLAGVLGRWSAFNGNGSAPLSTSFTIAVDGPVGWEFPVAVAPNGRYIAYTVAVAPAPAMLYVRPRDSFEARMLPGTEGARMPFWSPDSSQIGFRSGRQLKRIALVGGEPQTIADIGDPPPGTATWNEFGDILFDGSTGLERVSASGGVPAKATTLQPGDGAHDLPFFLPGGRRFLYTSIFKAPGGVYVQSLDSDERTLLVPGSGMAAYASGYLLLSGLDGTLTAQALDVDTLTLSGKPVRLANGVFGFSVSNGGVLAYRVGGGIADLPAVEQRQLAWYDRHGTKLANVGAPGRYRGIALSRDGRYAAVHRHDGLDSGDIWVLDLERGGLPTRRTFDGAHNIEPVWSPDGADIVYTGASYNLYRTPSAGGDAHDVVLDSARVAFASDWSSDGTVLVTYVPAITLNADIAVLTVGTGSLTPVLVTEFREDQPKRSPDGRWLAYLSDESGRYEVYVRQFPHAERQTRISTAGGAAPLWSADGKELFYLTPDGTVMAVAMHASEHAIEAEGPQPLFKPDILFDDHPSMIGDLHHWPYAVSPDGERFLINERVREAAPVTGAPGRGTIAVVVDWPAQVAR